MAPEPQLIDDTGQPTPITMFLAAHRAFRRDAARFPIAVQRAGAEASDELLAALRHHWEEYREVLVGHHQMEDEFLFPQLLARHPSLAEVIDRLEVQHTNLDVTLPEVTDRLAELPAAAAIEPAVNAFSQLATAITEHLDLEEEHLVPIMRADPPQPPQAGAGPEGDESGGPPDDMDYSFVAPWVADGLDPDVTAALLETLPPPARADFDHLQARYREQLSRWWW